MLANLPQIYFWVQISKSIRIIYMVAQFGPREENKLVSFK